MRVALPIFLCLLALCGAKLDAAEQVCQPPLIAIHELSSSLDPDCRHFGHFLRHRLGEDAWSDAATSLLGLWDQEGPDAAADFLAQSRMDTTDPAVLLLAAAAARVSFKYDLSRDFVDRIHELPTHPVHAHLSPTSEDEEALATAIAEASSHHGNQQYDLADAILGGLLEENSSHWRAGVISYLLVVNTYFGGDLERFHELGVAHLQAFPGYPFNARILHLLASKCNLLTFTPSVDTAERDLPMHGGSNP